MATIKNTLALEDRMSSTFRSITNAMGSTLVAIRSIKGANLGQEFAEAEAAVKKAELAVDDFDNALKKAEKSGVQTTQRTAEGFTILKGVAVTVIKDIINKGIEMGEAFIDFGNAAINAAAGVNRINDGLQTSEELNKKIFDSAQRSRTGYEDVRASVIQIGAATGEIFENNDQLIAFTELLNKQFMISGVKGQQAQVVMNNIVQAMNMGVLRGQDLNAVLMNTPAIARNIEQYLGAATGTIKELGEAGLITSDVLINSLYASADGINTQFNEMQDNFEDVTVVMSDKFKFAMEGMAIDFNLFLTDVIRNGTVWTIENIDAIAIAIVTLGSILAAVGVGMAISWAVANWPITLIILGIGFLINMLISMGATTDEILGFVGGIFGWLFGIVWNGVAIIWNLIAGVAEFIANVFIDPLGAVARLFLSVFDAILGIISTVAGAIGALFGQDWASGIDKFRNDLTKATTDMYGESTIKIARMEEKNVLETTRAGISTGAGLGNTLNDFTDKIKDIGASVPDLDVEGFELDSFGTNTPNGKAIKTANQNDIKIKDEDMKMLHDIATRDYQINYQQLTPQLSVTIDTVRETTDIDSVIDTFAEGIYEIIDSNIRVPA